MNEKISIIVPTYNVEKYIAKCLDSLVAQTYDNYDVLVINDGSPFGEQAIIDEYAKRYPDIIKGIQKENGGYGSVLEMGFAQSDAEYVLICDPDDYLASDALSVLYAYMKETEADLVVGAKTLVFSDNDEVKYDASFNPEFGHLQDKKLYQKGEKGFESLYFMEPSPHAKLYKRSLVSKIQFPHKVSYTDNLLYFYTLANVSKVTYCAKALSYYLIDREGNTRTDLKPTIIDAWITVFCAIMDQVKAADDIFYYRMFESFYSIYYKVDQINADKELKLQKYDLIYAFLEKLIPYREAILKKNKEYVSDSSVILAQKEKLLNVNSSRKMYDSLVHKRLNGSLKASLKSFVMNNAFLEKLYEKYHFYAKYVYTRKDERMMLKDGIACTPIHKEGTTFFGYYDKPCAAYGHTLVHRVNSDVLSLDQRIDILVDGEKVSSTTSWNWQQGSMASWFDEDHIIHNFFDGENYRSKLIDIHTKEEKVFSAPIYSLSKDRRFALTLNFSRLAKLRPDYGYFNMPYQNLPKEEEDGIFYLDLEKDVCDLFLSLAEIKNFKPKETMKDAVHKVNHIDIGPDSKKAIFLHRWYRGKTKYTRLLLVDIATKKLTVLADNDMVSHMAWHTNDKVFGFLKGNNGKDVYFFIDMEGNQEMFEDGLLIDDGHPTVYNERYIVTDTYPDYRCKSKLLLIDVKEHRVQVIGEFYSGIQYQGTVRNDLHPRFDKEGKSLTFDSVLDGKRKTYHLDLDKYIEDRV